MEKIIIRNPHDNEYQAWAKIYQAYLDFYQSSLTSDELQKVWSWILSALLFCPINKTFRGKLPKGPYIVVSNHSSYLDTVFMYGVIPDYFLFIGKGELLKWPLFGLFFRKQDIPVHRDQSRLAYNALQKAYEAIDRGECIAMYPEGTIPLHAPKMKAFKNGAFKMAIDKLLLE